MAGTGNDSLLTTDELLKLKHDIKNQLSNITLALEGLRYEMEDTENDISLYTQSMMQSAQNIDRLLDVIADNNLP